MCGLLSNLILNLLNELRDDFGPLTKSTPTKPVATLLLPSLQFLVPGSFSIYYGFCGRNYTAWAGVQSEWLKNGGMLTLDPVIENDGRQAQEFLFV